MDRKDNIEKAVRNYIEAKHKIGNSAGGSGHLSHSSYNLNNFESQEGDDGNTTVSFDYTIIIETEFTYYPDNPPYEDHYKDEMVLDKDLNIM